MLDYYISYFFRGTLWELMAAVAGLFYLKNYPKANVTNRIFVYYLCLTVCIDLFGSYNAIAYYSDYKFFGFIKDTVWRSNYWLYNIYKPFAFLIYFEFIKRQLISVKARKIITGSMIFFFVTAWIYLIISGDFFKAYAAYTSIVGSILLLTFIAFYMYEILMSDRILTFYRQLSFYVAVGALLWNLTITPMFIYNTFKIMGSSPEFLKIYLMVLSILNFVMYSLFTIGFVVEIRKQKGLQIEIQN